MVVEEKFNQKLLVEGNDDLHVVWALCKHFNIKESFDVIDCKGIGKLFDLAPIRFKEPGLKTVGIVLDADTDIAARWQSLRGMLSAFNPPANLPSAGLILTNKEGLRVGVWIMPNNITSGMLEDFISFLVPTDDQLMPVVDNLLVDIESRGIHKYQPVHKAKAKINSWLALQESPGTPMGQAITKRYLTTDEETCKVFVTWLKDLFADTN